MNPMKKILISTVMLFLMTSCATITKFPVSNVEPAADISAKIKKDKQNNYEITITAKYLASADRLTPPKNTYVVWIVTKENGVNNCGLLKNENAKTNSLKTLTSFEPMEIFITAEDEGNVTTPNGIEISRAVLNKNVNN
jgi:U3 small nucleolar ribonucleoprotein component